VLDAAGSGQRRHVHGSAWVFVELACIIFLKILACRVKSDNERTANKLN
jgi:hypothetical protein